MWNEALCHTSKGVLEELRRVWEPIFDSDVDKNWEAFYSQYGSDIEPKPCVLKPTSHEYFHAAFRHLNSTRATAARGYRVRELQALPRRITCLYAEMFQIVDQGAAWPSSLTEVHCSVLRKQAPPEADDDSPKYFFFQQRDRQGSSPTSRP